HDPDLIFDELNSIQVDSNVLSNAINPLSSPLHAMQDDQQYDHHKKKQQHRRKKSHSRRGSLSDDEDFFRDAEDGSTDWDWRSSGENEHFSIPQPPRIYPEGPTLSDGPFYFRITFTITNLPHDPELSRQNSPKFTRVAEDLVLGLEALYRTIPGQQAVTVLSFSPLPHSSKEYVLVTLDVGSLGSNDRESIEDVIKQVIQSGSLGKYKLSPEGFSVRSFGAATDQGIPQTCAPDEIYCTSFECVNAAKRCDGREDCRDGSDELGCPVRAKTLQSVQGCRSDDQMICLDGTCIDSIRVCDGVEDCTYGEDEVTCGGISECLPGEFQCDGLRCVEERRRCDGRPDCSDRSDESNCP
ncbi:basement membrane-specific heparan sulfate proteoglycan core protein-like, partial [Stegodyphus dumicola]|uniref:basement membrane-specific heparan sulfate proteoglycan core protein-like n=1 Tax=Stegodyphus dumicola TaxID=202533 RepID=UPI0015A77A0C